MSTNQPAARFRIEDIMQPAAFPHAVTHLLLKETHISWLVLTGRYAYKFKKPVHYDFLDASTLERRRYLCEEELRLNLRLAPDLYVDVQPVTAENGNMRLGGDGRIVEYAVRMHEFEASQELSSQLERGTVTPEDMAGLAVLIAEFHRRAAIARLESEYGTHETVESEILGNLTTLLQHLIDGESSKAIARLGAWSKRALAVLAPLIADRKHSGAVRECHGDLHAHNIVRWQQRWLPFDCIEFEPKLRWIDVMSDVAFLFMDLVARSRPDLAHAFLSRYLEQSGDYEGLGVLRLYAAYRALVRAKVDTLGAENSAVETARSLRARVAGRVNVAARLIDPQQPVLMIMHGVTASGKSWLSERLVSAINALRVRSDIERKRIADLASLERTSAGVGEGIYAAESSLRTYERLLRCGQFGLRAGFNMIVDATFLGAAERGRFRQLAIEQRCNFLIISCHASRSVLDARIEARARTGLDPSEATLPVLEHQLATQQALTPQDQPHTVLVDTSSPASAEAGIEEVRSRSAATPQP